MTVTLPEIDTFGAHGPAVARVTSQDMIDRNKLMTMDQVRERLSLTEPLDAVPMRIGERNTKFRLSTGWNHDVEEMSDSAPVDAFLTIGSTEYQLQKSALFFLTSQMGMNAAYATKFPPQLVEPHLNFYYGFMKEKDLKAYVHDGQVLALSSMTIDPYSNLRLLDEALAGIENKYGKNNIYADYKFTHNLQRTHLRLIVPETARTLQDTGEDNDDWSIGIQIVNSLIGQERTSIDGYLFRWACTNGAIDMNSSSKSTTWDRRSGKPEEELYEWARETVDDVLGGLEHTLDKVQEMVHVDLDDATSAFAKEVYRENKLSNTVRDLVNENLVNSDNLTLYSIMQSLTAAANNPDLNPAQVMNLLQAGGSMVDISHRRCNACNHLTLDHADH